MAFALATERLVLRLRTPDDAEWNLELLGEHPGGTTRTLLEARDRLAQQHAASLDSGIGFLTITRREEGDPIGYCGLFVGRATLEEPELASEL
jgi:hypothetical protein